MTSQDEDLAATYGPPARFCEWARGAHIRYKNADTSGGIASGRVLWVCAPGEIAGHRLPLRLIVEPDVEMGFVDVAFVADVIEEAR